MDEQKTDFAQEYVKDSRMKFLFLSILLLASMVINGVLSWKIADLQQESEITSVILDQTKKALKDSNDASAEKTSAALMHGVYQVNRKQARELAKLEIKYSKKYHIDLAIGLAISAQESKWNTRAVSYNSTSYGVKQIHCAVWCKELGVTKADLMDPEKNIELGYKILAQYLKQHGSMEKALMAYYGSTAKWENEQYMAQIMNRARLFDFS